MFGSKKSAKVEVKSTSRNVIGSGTKIVGDVISEGDFRIDGSLEGTLKTNGKVIIGKEGFVKGKIECDNADIEGKCEGELNVNNVLTVKSTASVTGNIIVGSISTEPGASLNTNCHMKGNVKETKKQND